MQVNGEFNEGSVKTFGKIEKKSGVRGEHKPEAGYSRYSRTHEPKLVSTKQTAQGRNAKENAKGHDHESGYAPVKSPPDIQGFVNLAQGFMAEIAVDEA